MCKTKLFVALATLIGLCAQTIQAEGLEPAVQAKIDSQAQQIRAWASDPIIVKAVKDHNSNPTAEQTAMTQEKWKTLTVLDPVVRAFSKNEAGVFLKTKKTELVSEAFISGADGTKVAFLSKPTLWSHKGKSKHEVPMTDKVWQGPIEVDDSTGLQQIQVSVPVLDAGKPIGSVVVGLRISKLEQ